MYGLWMQRIGGKEMRKILTFILALTMFPFASAQSEDVFGSAFETLRGLGFWSLIVIGIIIVLALIVGGVIVWRQQKRKWYLKIEFKMIRSDGKIIVPEWGKGFYDSKKGILWVKRNKLRKEYIKATDLKLYLQGQDTITVVGNSGNWKPIIPDSFIEVIDNETGEEASMMSVRVDMREDKPWAVQTERMLEDAFSIASFWNSIKDYLGWGLVIFVTIVGQAVVYYLLKGN